MSTNNAPAIHCGKLCECSKCEPIRWALIGWRDHTDAAMECVGPLFGLDARGHSANQLAALQATNDPTKLASLLYLASLTRGYFIGQNDDVLCWGLPAKFHTTSKDMPGSRAKLVAIMALPVLESGKVHREAIENIYRGDA